MARTIWMLGSTMAWKRGEKPEADPAGTSLIGARV
jgi:hypothetical protein